MQKDPNSSLKSNLYLTETEKLPKINISSLNPFSRKSKSKTSRNPNISQNLPVGKKTNNFLDEFTINHQTTSDDFQRIEDKYTNSLISLHSTYNNNKTIISRKQAEYNSLVTSIETQIITVYQIHQDDLTNYYNELISKLKAQIRVREHEIECYNNYYKRLYKSNYLVKKRYEEVIKIQKMSEEQHEKYEILKNNAMMTITRQTQVLNNMKFFYELSSATYQEEYDKSKERVRELEYQVGRIRKEVEMIQEEIEASKEKRKDISNEIIQYKKINQKIKRDCHYLLVDIVKFKATLIAIYNHVKVKKLDDVIVRYNLNVKTHTTLKSLFSIANKDIVRLNNELTLLQKEKDEVDYKIKHRLNFEIEDEIKLKSTNTKGLKAFNRTHSLIIQKKEQLVKNAIGFIIKYNFKMERSIKKGSDKNYSIINNCFNSNNPMKKQLASSFITINKKASIEDRVQLKYKLFNSEKFTKETYKFLIMMLNYLIMNFFLILSKILNSLSFQVISPKNKNFEVIKLNDYRINTAFDSSVVEALNRLEQKEKMMRKIILANEIRREKILYSTDIPRRKRSVIISYDQNYTQRDSNIISNKRDNFYNKNLRFSTKVTSNINNNNTFINSRKNLNRLSTEPTMGKRIIKPQQEVIINGNEVLNYSDIKDEEEYNNFGKKKNTKDRKIVRKYALVTKNPEMDKVYMRMNDLRKLELYYCGAREREKDSYHTTNFIEIYLDFKNKYFRKKNSAHFRRESHDSKETKRKKNSNNIIYSSNNVPELRYTDNFFISTMNIYQPKRKRNNTSISENKTAIGFETKKKSKKDKKNENDSAVLTE